MLNNKIALRIISLIIAIILWIYVMGEVNPVTSLKINDIQVSFTNTEMLASDGLAVVEKDPIVVSAIVKGKRSKVNEAAENGLTATVDVNGCHEGKNQRVVNINLPSGISLESISREAIEFQVENRISEDKPVEVSFVGDSGDGNKVPWSGDYDYLYVNTSGAESSVNKIKAVKGTISVGELTTASKDFYIDLVPIDKNGNTVYGITMNHKGINVSAQLLTAKKIKLNLSTKNLQDGLAVQDIQGQQTVKVIGTDDNIKAIEEIGGVIDLSSVSGPGEYKLKVELNSLPKGIYQSDTKKEIYAVVSVKAA